MQPGLVHERVIRDLVSGIGDLPQRVRVLRQHRISADDEECDVQAGSLELTEHPGNDPVQIRRETGPVANALGFQIGPLIVEIDRDTGTDSWTCV